MRRQTWQASLGALASVLLILSTQSGCGGSKSSSGGGDDDDDGTKTGTKDASTTSKDGGKPTTYVEGGVTHYSDGAVEYEDGSMIPVGPMCTTNADCTIGLCGPGGTCEPTDNDNEVDGAETDTDCGGALNADGTMNAASDGAPACKTGKNCVIGLDCADKVCFTGPAVELSNGGAPVDCPSGATCTCQAPTVTDGVQNDSETDIDCGGKLGAGGVANPDSDQAMSGAALCTAAAGATGQHCLYGTDCDQGICNHNAGSGGLPLDCPNDGTACTCQLATATDGLKNGGETDVDCGGATTQGSDGAPPCADVNPVTMMPSSCVVAADCQSIKCSTAGKCVPATSTDGIKNGGETDIDCGGATAVGSDGAPKCPDVNVTTRKVSACSVDADCKSSFCSVVEKVCVDGQSCKGTIAPATIQDIKTHASLVEGGADATGQANVHGAGEYAGLNSCGRGESTDDHSVAAGLVSHESCCRSLPVSVVEPGAAVATTVRVDKYEVTSGRMRQFIEAANIAEGGAPQDTTIGSSYNLRKWVKAQFSTDGHLTPITPIGVLLAQQIPTNQSGATDIIDLFPASANGDDPVNMVQQLGGTTMDEGYPSDVQGCFVGNEAFGASTYWWSSDGEAQVGSPPRPFTQDYYDVKSLNCVPYWMAAAFCAWDGGRLPNPTEERVLYGNSNYPWGPSFIPNPYPGNQNIYAAAMAAGVLVTDYTVNFNNSGGGNTTGAGDFYYYPSYAASNPGTGPLGADAIVDTLTTGTDLSVYISAPGRFTPDLTTLRSSLLTGVSEGWQDFGANMMEFMQATDLVSSGGAFCDTHAHVPYNSATCTGPTACARTNPGDSSVDCGVLRTGTMPDAAWEGGSWEGHGVAYSNFSFPIHTQYGKTGFRCERASE